MTKAPTTGPRVVLPQVVAGRPLADRIADGWTDVRDRDVVVDAYQLASSNEAFADQLVLRVLVDGAARSLTVYGGPATFWTDLRDASVRYSVEPSLHLMGSTDH